MIKPLQNVTFGTDPEGFFQKNGEIIGSEKIIPENGLWSGNGYYKDVVRDGVQFELNPPANGSLLSLGQNISSAFKMIQSTLKNHPGVSVNFSGVVEVAREELDSLSPATRVLGCMPSKNVYGVRPITVDAKVYRKRSAGGHHHFGLTQTNLYDKKHVDERQRAVYLLDILVGNTCVLLDRDPGAAERRENYGRAGEYRLAEYGVEYRTLSNFWLRSYTLMSFVFGMSHLALSILSDQVAGTSTVEDELAETVNISLVEEAINTNNFSLALENWNTLIPILVRNLPNVGFPLNPGTVLKFQMLAEAIHGKGLQEFFPEDPVQHWVGKKFVPFDNWINQI